MIGLPRSTYYYRAQGSVTLTDSELEELIGTVQDELPRYGYRRVTHELRRRGHMINHKRVARVMRAKGMGIKTRRRHVRTTDSKGSVPGRGVIFGGIGGGRSADPGVELGWSPRQAV